MFISIRKEEAKLLPSSIQERGIKLTPMVQFSKFNNKYEQTWKSDKNGNYIREKREPKWKYKVYLCGSYRAQGKVRNKQILLETIYYWDIVDKYLNIEKKQKKIFNMNTNQYDYHEFNESWLDLFVFEKMSDEVFICIREWINNNDKSIQRVLCGLITDQLISEIMKIEDDYKTTAEYKICKVNEKVIEKLLKEVEWLNSQNSFG